ncbi:MAG: hypothetical protein KF878_11760 [Planctomycetes bacterium]|nr:hypothetical protein [Planctomycetota bacterium]
MAKYKPAGEEATFTIKVKQVKAGSSYTLDICQVARGSSTVLKSVEGTWADSCDEKDGMPIEISGGTATVRWKAEGPPADGDARSWRVLAKVTITDDKGKKREQTSPELEVYHDWVEVASVRDDGSKVEDASFKLLVNKRSHAKESTGKAGKVKVADLPPGPLKLEWQKPFALDKYVEEKGTALKAQLRVGKRARLAWPRGTQKKPHRQLVNLTADAKAPQQGSLVKVQLELEGGVAGDKVYVRHSLSPKNSKRNDVVLGLAGATCTSWAPEGGVEVTLGGDAPKATVDLEMGKAGGDVVTLEVGGTDQCKDGSVTIQGWRKVWYQISAPAGTEPPGMQRLIKCMADVFVDYEELKADRVKIKEADAGMPAGSWYDAKLVGGKAGERYLNVGDYNRVWFHDTYFKKTKAPHECHVLYAHTQMDYGAEEMASVTLSPGDEREFDWPPSPGTRVKGHLLKYADNVFPVNVKTGGDAFVSGIWKEKGGANRRGDLTAADVHCHFPKHPRHVAFKLPADAVDALSKGNDVLVRIFMHTMKGTFLGEAMGGTGKQLIATHVRDKGERTANSTVNDVMAHELGHVLGQAVKSGGEPPGLSHADHKRQYTNMGHQGSHCADGMKDADFGDGAGSGLADFSGYKKCRCIMYGENDQDGSNSNGLFCGRCKPFLMAQAMDAIP